MPSNSATKTVTIPNHLIVNMNTLIHMHMIMAEQINNIEVESTATTEDQVVAVPLEYLTTFSRLITTLVATLVSSGVVTKSRLTHAHNQTVGMHDHLDTIMNYLAGRGVPESIKEPFLVYLNLKLIDTKPVGAFTGNEFVTLLDEVLESVEAGAMDNVHVEIVGVAPPKADHQPEPVFADQRTLH